MKKLIIAILFMFGFSATTGAHQPWKYEEPWLKSSSGGKVAGGGSLDTTSFGYAPALLLTVPCDKKYSISIFLLSDGVRFPSAEKFPISFGFYTVDSLGGQKLEAVTTRSQGTSSNGTLTSIPNHDSDRLRKKMDKTNSPGLWIGIPIHEYPSYSLRDQIFHFSMSGFSDELKKCSR